MSVFANRYHVGEAPLQPLQYQFQDSAGLPLDITAHSAVTFGFKNPAGTKTEVSATIVSAWNGYVAVDWTAAMTASAGAWSGTFKLTPGPVESVIIRWAVIESPHP